MRRTGTLVGLALIAVVAGCSSDPASETTGDVSSSSSDGVDQPVSTPAALLETFVSNLQDQDWRAACSHLDDTWQQWISEEQETSCAVYVAGQFDDDIRIERINNTTIDESFIEVNGSIAEVRDAFRDGDEVSFPSVLMGGSVATDTGDGWILSRS